MNAVALESVVQDEVNRAIEVQTVVAQTVVVERVSTDPIVQASSKPCGTCGREIRFYTLAMDPKAPPAEDVTCGACDGREIVAHVGCKPRSV